MTAPAVLDHAPMHVQAHVLHPAALKAARLAAGHTLQSVAAALGRPNSWSVVSRYETGRVDPPSSILGVLAGLYGVSVADFYRTAGAR